MPQRFSPTAVAHHPDLYNGRSRGQLHFVTHFTRAMTAKHSNCGALTSGEKRTVRVLSRQADAFSSSNVSWRTARSATR
jgi:hypothetical protein